MSVPDIDDRDLPAQLVAEVFAELNPLWAAVHFTSQAATRTREQITGFALTLDARHECTIPMPDGQTKRRISAHHNYYKLSL